MITLQGTGVSRGLAFGKLHFFVHDTDPAVKSTVEDVEAEVERFEAARQKAVSQLAQLSIRAEKDLGEENALLFQIHQMMLEDPDYTDSVTKRIRSQHINAEYAVQETEKQFTAMLSKADGSYIRGRTIDVLDISNRVISILCGAHPPAPPQTDAPCIIAADDLTPSETAQLDKKMTLAFVTSGGSPNAHTAIFARTLGIPAVVNLGVSLLPSYEGREVIVDGESGKVYVDPDEATRVKVMERQEAEKAHRTLLLQYRGKQTQARSGETVKLYANISSTDDMEAVLENDAEGIGLFRSEFLYLRATDFPSEEAQFAAYKEVVQKMQGKPVIIRTLDIGADKRVSYFHLPREENPAMGMRAIRICLTRPDIFRTQLRAIYRAAAFGNVAIMFPMITSVEELQRCKEFCTQVRQELAEKGIPFGESVPLGIMVETPAAALTSDLLAREADFFSIGTNDLAQYTLACDRQNTAVTAFCNMRHRAVFDLIEFTAKNAHKAHIPVGICVELAADFRLAKTFLKMGIDELSVPPSVVLRLRAHISTLDLSEETL